MRIYSAVQLASLLITMNLLLTPTAWILALAIAYLFFVYGLLWWAQRLGKAGKRRSIL